MATKIFLSASGLEVDNCPRASGPHLQFTTIGPLGRHGFALLDPAAVRELRNQLTEWLKGRIPIEIENELAETEHEQ